MTIENNSNPESSQNTSSPSDTLAITQAAPAQEASVTPGQAVAEPKNKRRFTVDIPESGEIKIARTDGTTVETPSDAKVKLNELAAQIRAKTNKFAPIPAKDTPAQPQADTSADQTEAQAQAPAGDVNWEKRFKDTQAELTKKNQKIKEYEGIDPKEYKELKEFADQAVPILRNHKQLVEHLNKNPEVAQQLLDAGTIPSGEDWESVKDDPKKFREWFAKSLVEILPHVLPNVVDSTMPEIAKTRVGVRNMEAAQAFLDKHFEGNAKHPEVIKAQPYLSQIFAEHAAEGQYLTLEQAFKEYWRMQKIFGSTSQGKQQKAGENTTPSAKASTQSTPEPSPQLPPKYPGVAANGAPRGRARLNAKEAVAEAFRLKGVPLD